ncbi:hypothetical protein LR48_Vigan05g133200 [Vigna angularis]|uniref:Uncharacterized protein n=1 Tax=Phaseolus angularis TaxID=3914 RepID=A0A0L9UMD3_PHAAN|nr:hypothetical protein LR48_Vigan05g133200 [Vigna angularis]
MAIVSVSSSEGSAGRDNDNSSIGDGSSFPSSVLSSVLDKTDREGGRESGSPVIGGERVINGVSLFFLQGGVDIDVERPEPEGCWPVIDGYGWASHKVLPILLIGNTISHAPNVKRCPLPIAPERMGLPASFRGREFRSRYHSHVSIFLHYYQVRPLTKVRWVSLNSIRNCCLFKPYSDSFKNFKKRSFKVIIKDSNRSEFHDEAGVPPFYWTRDPRKLRATLLGIMTPAEVDADKMINTLPRHIPARILVECLGHEDFEQMAFRVMSLSTPRKTSYVPSVKHKGMVSSKEGDPRSADSSHATGSQSRSKVKPIDPTTAQEVAQQILVVELSSAEAVPNILPVKKRKSKEWEKSSSKRSRREGSVPHLILGGRFGPDFTIGDCVDFCMSSSQRAVVEPLSEKDITNVALEFATRGAMLTWYLRKFADRHGAGDRSELLRKLDEANRELRTIVQQLKDAWARSDWIIEEAGRLKVEVRRLGEKEEELQIQNDSLTAELVKANEAISTLNTNVQIEHEEGFTKALRQATFLLEVDPLAVGFDISQDVYDGKMLPVGGSPVGAEGAVDDNGRVDGEPADDDNA